MTQPFEGVFVRISKRAAHREKVQKRLALYWTQLLYMQLAADAVVLLLWLVPVPNPVKLLAVTFHEVSHGIAAILTGGRVFGFALAPGGGGVTLGIGGSLPVILLAGYIGSSLWGIGLYYISVKWKPAASLISLEVVLIASAFFGWLNDYTMTFGMGALVLLTAVFAVPSNTLKRFFVQIVGSACCLYAPLDVLSDIVSLRGPLMIDDVETMSDVRQMADLSGIPAPLIGFFILLVQTAVLIGIVRWTCRHGAREHLHEERVARKHQEKLLAEVRSDTYKRLG
jgi:hypothetical protein